jgi:hypothetical protein
VEQNQFLGCLPDKSHRATVKVGATLLSKTQWRLSVQETQRRA